MAKYFPGGRKIILQSFAERGVRDETANTMLDSITNSTLKQYNSALKLYWVFYNTHNTSLFHADITEILTFLSEEFKRNTQFNSIRKLNHFLQKSRPKLIN